MRIKVRDAISIAGIFILDTSLFMWSVGENPATKEDLICAGASTIIGVLLLVIGLNMQSKFSKEYYGDNKIVNI